jgi:hypothetical protein
MCSHCKLLFSISLNDTVPQPAAATEDTDGNTSGESGSDPIPDTRHGERR